MADDAKLRILIEAILDEKGIKQAENALKDIGKEGTKTGELVKTAGRDMTGFMDKAIGFISSIGMVSVAVGGALTPIVKSAQSYVSTVQMADATSREWLATTYQIEQATLKGGKAAADFLLPAWSKIGDVVEKIGDFAEENPKAAVTGMGVTGAVGAIGITEILGFALKKFLPGLAGAGGAGATLTTGAAAEGAGILSGVASLAPLGFLQSLGLIGMGMGGKLDKDDPKSKIVDAYIEEHKLTGIGLLEFLKQQSQKQKSSGGETNSDVSIIEEGEESTLLERITKAIEKAFEGIFGGGSNTKSEFKTTELLKAQYEFRKAETYAQEDFNRQWDYAIKDFNRNRLYQEEDYNRQRGIAFRNFAVQQAQSEKMFYMQRAIAQRDYQISVARNEYDYQLSQKRATEDYNFSLKQIMLSGDALSYYYAERQFKIDQQRQEEDYQLQKQRAAEDFQRQQTDSLMFFNIERAFSKQMFEIQMQDQEIQYQIMRDRAKWEFENVTLKRMYDEYKIMANRRLQSFYDSIMPEIITENNLRLRYEESFRNTAIQGYIDSAEEMAEYFNQLIANYSNYGLPNDQNMYPGIQNRQSGGYTSNQAYMLHDHEFVLSPSTTRHAEQVAQGTLSQDKIISMLSGGGGFVYNDSRQFSRGLSIEEKTMLRQELRQMVVEAFR